MTADGGRGILAHPDIVFDEVGVAFAVVGDCRLKTLFQPVFAKAGRFLVPVAVSASGVLQRRGSALADSGTGDLTTSQRDRVAHLTSRLAVLNLVNLGADRPDLQVIATLPDSDISMEEFEAFLAEAAAAGVGLERLIVDCVAFSGDRQAQAGMIATKGALLSVDVFAQATFPAMAAPRPGCVARIGAHMFRRLMSEPSLQRLLPALAAALQRLGFLVHVDGIERTDELRIAIAARADRFTGDLLGMAALAGTDFDDRPKAIADLIGDQGNVVSLLG